MKKLLILLVFPLLFNCSTDECFQESYAYKRVSTVKLDTTSTRSISGTLTITKDTLIEGNINVDFLRFNGKFTADIAGTINVVNFAYMSGGTLVADDVTVGSNVYFNGFGGKIVSRSGINIYGHAVAYQPTDGVKAQLVYCEDYFVSILDDEWIDVVQDCETLDVPDITGMIYLGTTDVACDFSFDNQSDPTYFYVEIDD